MSEYVLLEEDPDEESVLSACDLIEPTEDEAEEGRAMGEAIDPEDDDDNGLEGVLGLAFTRALTDRDSAVAKARAFKRVLLAHGVPEVSIEIVEGRPSSYGRYDSLFVVSDMSHHIVSSYSSRNLTPGLSLIKHGRSDLEGPLANGYGGWDLCYRIITFGYANHPGEGGPRTVPALTAGEFTIPKDSARRYAWGTEWEGGLRESDWDRVYKNPRNGKRMSFREFMGRCNAAIEAYHKIHPLAHLEHSTWTSRKIDRLNYSAAKGIAEKRPYRITDKNTQQQNTQKDWFDMATTEDLQKAIRTTPILVDPTNKVTWPLQKVLRNIMVEQDRVKALLSSDRLASAIKAALPAGASTDLTDAQIEAAVEKGVRDVLGSLDS